MDGNDETADRSDMDAVTGELDNETAADESGIEAALGEVDNAAGAEGEPSADVSSRKAMADGSDILRVLRPGRNGGSV